MQKIKNIIKKIGQGHTNFALWWVTNVPPFLLFLALIWLVIISLRTFHEDTLNKQIVIFYLSGIGLSISLASASFSYARVCEEVNKKRVICGGEHFFYAAILLITAMLINWLIVEARQFFDNFILLKKIRFILSLFLGLSYVPAIFAAQSIVRGFWELDRVLFPKTYD
ncbi:MAG TPA: hypothetical protein VI727_03575 [Candidatus Brocadiaceae bacterium]|nr:hypothetical protein [Candidatus Brocadiaceae bacterium]